MSKKRFTYKIIGRKPVLAIFKVRKAEFFKDGKRIATVQYWSIGQIEFTIDQLNKHTT